MEATLKSDKPAAETAVQGKKILIVEDERPLILMVRRVLSKAGFEIVGEVTVEAGLKRLQEEDFDLILLDYMLPDQPGTEMVKVLGDRVETLPIIMLTGYTDVRLAVEVMKSGVADYVVKDARLEFIQSLPKKVEDIIERFRLRRENLQLQQRIDEVESRLEQLAETVTTIRSEVAAPAGAWLGEAAEDDRGAALLSRLKEILG